MTMPSTHDPAGSPDPRRPETDATHTAEAPDAHGDGAADATEERRTSWRLRRRDERDRAAAEERIRNQGTWVDLQVRQAMDRGDFDELPGLGKPMLPDTDDPDWWVKHLVERENVTGVLPPALQLRKDDADLDGALDRLYTEKQVREAVQEFNDAVRRARSTRWAAHVITDPRDVEDRGRPLALAPRDAGPDPAPTRASRPRSSRGRSPRGTGGRDERPGPVVREVYPGGYRWEHDDEQHPGYLHARTTTSSGCDASRARPAACSGWSTRSSTASTSSPRSRR